MLCAACNQEIADNAKFCRHCGATVSSSIASPATKKCPQCGGENAISAKFCRVDGFRFDGAQPTATTAQAHLETARAAAASTTQLPSSEPARPAEQAAGSVVCPQCGTVNAPGATFCKTDGFRLADSTSVASELALGSVACPTCGTENVPGAKFCRKDGTPLAGPAETPRPTRPSSPQPVLRVGAGSTATSRAPIRPADPARVAPRKWLVPVLAVILITLAGGGGGFLYWTGVFGDRHLAIQEALNARFQSQGLAGVKAMVRKDFSADVTGTVSTSDQKQKALALVREEKSLTRVYNIINVLPTVGEAAKKQAEEERRAADAAHDFLPTEGKEQGASLEKAVDKVHQEAIMRLRTIFWYDIRWSNDVFNVNDKGTIWGKFHVFEGWPETMAQPDAAFLNIDIEEMDTRDPAFVIQEAYIGGQPAFNIPASYIVGQLVPRPRPVHLKTGADYTFKVVLKARRPGKWRVRPTISVEGSSPVTSPGIQLTVKGPIYSFNYDALPVLDTGPVHSKPMKEPPSPIKVAVDDATYDVPRSTMHMKLTVTNKGNRAVQLSEFDVAAIRFWNDAVRSRWELSERSIYGGYKEKGKEGELEVTFNDDPILPGHTRTQKVMAISSAWEASALWEVIGSSNNRFAGMLFFTSGDDREKVVIDAPLGRTPTTRPAVPFAAQGTKASPTEVADIPDVRVGDTYLVDSQYPNNAKLNNMTERKVVSVIDGGVTVASRNVKSRSGQSRMLRYTQEWNFVSSRNADGSGLDYLPPLKYFEFPLYPGKSWRQTSRETNVKTGATRDFTLSATVGEWENISVPAGTFRAIKITTQSEIVDSVSGQRSTGTDVSWYAPDVRRSIKSVITSRNMQGDVEDQFIHVAQYQVNR